MTNDHSPLAPEAPLPTEPDDYDSPWKEAVEHYFPEFMAFYFPAAYAQIDWAQGHVFLDQELQAVVQDAVLGKRFVDKLIRVTLTNGLEKWIYIHLEIQGQVQPDFAERMFVYNYRIYDRYKKPVASMAVLADDTPDWRPSEYRQETLGSQQSLTFPIAKLLDYAGQEEALFANPNAFALVTLASLQTRATRKDMNARYAAKWRLVQLLYQRGWDKQRIIDLFSVLDWLMRLPPELSNTLWQNIGEIEENKKMRYVTSVERITLEKVAQQAMQQGMQEGRQEGVQQGLQQGEGLLLQKQLTRRFGNLPAWVPERIGQAAPAQLETWGLALLDAASLDEVFNAH